MIHLFILLVIGLVLLHLYFYHGRVGSMLRKLPGPTIWPVFGNLLDFQVPHEEMYRVLRRCSAKYYPAYRLILGPKALINIRHPDDIEVLLSSQKFLTKDFAYEHIRSWLKTGLLTSTGGKWHQRRKILTPAFHFNILKKYYDITKDHGKKAVDDLISQGYQTTQDLTVFCTDFTLNVVCDSAMGVSLEDEAGHKYKDAVYRMGKIIFQRAVNPFVQDWMLPLMPKLNKETKEVIKTLDDFISKIVRERREYHQRTNYQHLENLENDKNSESDYVYSEGKKRLAMLDLLIAAEKNGLIDDDGIKEEVATFVFEGHDTTAVSLIYTIMLLAENKEAQDQARHEVVTIIKSKNGDIQLSDLSQMNYLERCLKESLRLFPSVPSIGRYMTEDLQFKNFLAPKGSNVNIHIVDTHRDPNFWPEPDKFDPDRFLPENSKGRHPFCYVPFSAGSRNCIGQKFAMMELKFIMARILSKFYLEPIDYVKDIEFTIDLVMRSNRPLHTKFIKIH